jgi:aminopeptidase YwaD
VRERIEGHLRLLVEGVGPRPPGSPANRRAAAYASQVLAGAGLAVAEQPFSTRWWTPGAGRLEARGRTIELAPDPFSLPCDVRGLTRRVGTMADLEALEPDPARILVLHDELTREQLMPLAFPFLEVPAHARVRAALERLGPAAVISVSDHWQPIIEDPDLALPSTTIRPRLARHLGDDEKVRLVLGGSVHEGDGVNVSARTGGQGRRVVLSAHLDSKATTPGAFDNAAAVAVLLALAEEGLHHLGALEVVLFNGEDHFDACGEVAWLAETDLAEVAANINVDGIGLAGRGTSLAMLACPEALERRLVDWLRHHTGWALAEPWLESDHAVFAMRGIPAVAVTSEDVHTGLSGLVHGAADTIEVLDLATLVGIAEALPQLLAMVVDALGARPSR